MRQARLAAVLRLCKQLLAEIASGVVRVARVFAEGFGRCVAVLTGGRR